MSTKTKPSVKAVVGTLTAGKKAHEDGAKGGTQAEAPHKEQSVTDQQPAQEPTAAADQAASALGDGVQGQSQAEHQEQAVTDPQPAVEQAQAHPEAATDQAVAVGESPSSIDSILDKNPLGQRIIEILALVDRIDRQKLCDQLDSPPVEFKIAVNELAEAKVIKDDAITKTVYLLLTEDQRKAHKEKLAIAKGHDQFVALQWILDHHTYREDYASWDEFLHHELCVENPHDWWETQKRQVRIQQQMKELGVKFKVPLNKDMARHLNRVRNDAALFVSCVSEFQGLPQNRQIAKRLGEIVQRHLDHKTKLSSLRQFVPDATEEELTALAPIYAADQKWRNWYPQHTTKLRERVQASGQPIRDCLLEIAQEIKALPGDTVLLGVARGADELEPLVKEMMRIKDKWVRDQKDKDEIEAWKKQGVRLQIYDPASGQVHVPNTKDEEPKPEREDQVATHPEADEPEITGITPPEPSPRLEVTGLYDVELSGDFGEFEDLSDRYERMSADDLAILLQELAEAIEEGATINAPSSITIRPAVRQEQSA